MSLNPNYSKDIKKGSISRWLKNVIVLSHNSANVSLDSANVRAHETRALASFIAFALGAPLETILKTAYWRSRVSFIDFYLRDVHHLCSDGVFTFAPAVFAGHPSRQ